MTSAPAAAFLGATDLGSERCLFRVWAPFARSVQVHLGPPRERILPLSPAGGGYHESILEEVSPGCRYRYRLDGEAQEYADPASRSQPEGVHGPSAVVGRHLEWTDSGWRGLPLRDLLFYEIHVGTFTPEGTFEAIVPKLDGLRELGVTCIELMPVAQFPGERNWGYDGVFPYAAQSSYGGAAGLARLVDACHRRGMAVALDVVYNHLGPEGNAFGRFGPYFTDRYRTPWGAAINFDGPESDEVRRFFVENALYWLSELHLDVLRLDAVHAIDDSSPRTFLEELSSAVKERLPERRVHLVAESALNDARLIRPAELGGYGLDAVWNDDFHHSLRALLTGERGGYFQDYGSLPRLEKAFREGFAYSGEYSAYRRRRHGVSSRDLPAERFVVFSQNHDQIGNRLRGDRLSESVSLEQLKLAASTVLLSPYLPLLFMGEEYGESAPFPYFVSHGDPELVEAVRRGRKEEFSRFEWGSEPPDPQDEATFRSAVLTGRPARTGWDRALRPFYRELIRLRNELPSLAGRRKEAMQVRCHQEPAVLEVHYWTPDRSPSRACAAFHFGDGEVQAQLSLAPSRWEKRLDSTSPEWGGERSDLPRRIDSPGSVSLSLAPWSAVLYEWIAASEDGKIP